MSIVNADLLFSEIDSKSHDFFGRMAPETIEVSRYSYEDGEGGLESVFRLYKQGWGCVYCGEYADWLIAEQDGVFAVESKTRCAVVELKPTVVNLPVLSGRIIFSDDLTDESYNEGPDGDFDLNSLLGRQSLTRAMETIGIAYGSVLNTDPDIWYSEALGEILVANYHYDENDDPINPGGDFVHLGFISTSLWAYSIADEEDFLRRGGSLSDDMGHASVTAGTYEFTHFADLPDFEHHDGDAPVIFARGKLLS